MKICFECVGFVTNPVFILDTDNDDARPIPYGMVDHSRPSLRYWPENYDPELVSEEDILTAYRESYAKHGVAIHDVSKAAWLERRFGEQKDT